MSHPLTAAETVRWRNPNGPTVLIPVERMRGGRLRIVADKPVEILKVDAKFAELPSRLDIVREDGAVLEAEAGRRLYISIETHDPYHLVTELPVEIIV